MASQGAPEVPKWLPRCSRDAKVAPRMSKRKHQGPQMAPNGDPAKPKRTEFKKRGGRRKRAQPLRFAAPLQGEPGVSRATHHALQNLKTQAGLPTAAGPSKLEPKMLHFHASIPACHFCMQNLQNLRKLTPKGTPFGSPNPPRSYKKAP